MRYLTSVVAGVFFVVSSAGAALAEIKVAVECNRGGDATPQFKFKQIPAPTANDAASTAKFTVVAGRVDPNGGDPSVLHDGKLPTEADEPARNFFFAQREDGGRLALDLGKVIEVKQVNTYSWHPGTRGPQVYKLYAADGTASGFDAHPKKGADPTQCGWKLLASVEARGSGKSGGQYGVSIADSAGALGKCRYLLFDISATEKDDPFGNTFFSHVSVIDANESKPPQVAVPAGPAERLVSQSPAAANYQIAIDYSEVPELADWVKTKLQPTCDTWYPKIVEALPSKDFTAPDRVEIVITVKYRGVAATGGTRISCGAAWFKQNLKGEALGAVVHELVHVVQRYRGVRGGSPNPGWLVEGVADYIRWFKFEPRPTGTRPRDLDHANYSDSYRTTAGFLNYVVEKHDKQLVEKLNAAMREGRYKPDLWKEYTGKTVDELWKEYVASLRQSPKAAIVTPKTTAQTPEAAENLRPGWRLPAGTHRATPASASPGRPTPPTAHTEPARLPARR